MAGNMYDPDWVQQQQQQAAAARWDDPSWVASQYAQQAANQAAAAPRLAYQTARDAALGMMNPGSVGTGGVDYGKAQADPSAALRAFDASGYTEQQAFADGWGSGVGTPGWQSTPQSQHLNPDGNNMAAMNPQDPNWGKQAVPATAATIGPQQAGSYAGAMRPGQSSGGSGMSGNSAGAGQGIYAQLGQQLGAQQSGPGGIYQQLGSMLGQNQAQSYGSQGYQQGRGSAYGASQSPYGSSMAPQTRQAPSWLGQQQGGGSQAASSGGGQQYGGGMPQQQRSTGVPPGGYGQPQRAGGYGQSPGWQSFLGNFGGGR